MASLEPGIKWSFAFAIFLVQFTAQTRFSLIQEAAPVDSESEEYTSLMEKRESYNPYCPLQKDDVDFVRKIRERDPVVHQKPVNLTLGLLKIQLS